ncbi:hypothetical protein ACFL59_08220 [Planctomycetota bacterium]
MHSASHVCTIVPLHRLIPMADQLPLELLEDHGPPLGDLPGLRRVTAGSTAVEERQTPHHPLRDRWLLLAYPVEDVERRVGCLVGHVDGACD